MNPETPRSTPEQKPQPEAFVTDFTKYAAERALGVISGPPGVLSPETLAKIEASKHAPRHGDTITIAPEDFKGDTSQVMNHPDNPSTQILKGIGKALDNQSTHES
jgi:hypothetical protein